ncbi:hypothetical protein M9H77_19340 [Catharanthus roseus]|uniref:Uncharacterized protein n=1 Tax=Catharanthus roseus TaxID=4058 RepID=A0ACC0BA60_CATRO|nr:hypothetical protein M9H77_19340 [Catharanthus roseus]
MQKLAEFRALSFVVPTRECDFLTYRTKLNDETKVVVDVSIGPLIFLGLMAQGRRRPSECIIQAMPNGFSKILWVEHVEIHDLIIHSMSRSIISSGYAYGAKHWVSLMKQQYAPVSIRPQLSSNDSLISSVYSYNHPLLDE